jgi:hypothetical protein
LGKSLHVFDDNFLYARHPAPILIPGLDFDQRSHILPDKLEGAGADRMLFKSPRAYFLVVVDGKNPANTSGDAVIQFQEIDKGFFEMKDDGTRVNELDTAVHSVFIQLIVQGGSVEPAIVFIAPLNVSGGEGRAIMKLEPRA